MQRKQRIILWLLMGVAFLGLLICGCNGFATLTSIPLSTLSSGGPAGAPVRAALDARTARGIFLLSAAEACFWIFLGLLVFAWVDERLRGRASRGFPVVLKPAEQAIDTQPDEITERLNGR